MNAILTKRRYRRWGTVMGFVAVVGGAVAPAYLAEIVLPDDYSLKVFHLLVLAGVYASSVLVIVVVLRFMAPRPGLGVGLLEGAGWGVLLLILVVPALYFVAWTHMY